MQNGYLYLKLFFAFRILIVVVINSLVGSVPLDEVSQQVPKLQFVIEVATVHDRNHHLLVGVGIDHGHVEGAVDHVHSKARLSLR